MTWRYLGDLRVALMGLRAGLLQLMHPAFSAAIEQHSRLAEAPWERLLRSVGPVMGVVYDGPRAEATALRVRDFHQKIRGTDAAGRAYHALEPATFFWGHATISEAVVKMVEVFDRPPTPADRAQLYRESLQWYALYGTSDRGLPTSWLEFQAYFDRTCEDVLQCTPAARLLLDWVEGRSTMALPGVPRRLSAALVSPLLRTAWFIARGTLPPRVRMRLGYGWSPEDERRLRFWAGCIRAVWPRLPSVMRYQPVARRAFRRSRGRVPD